MLLFPAERLLTELLRSFYHKDVDEHTYCKDDTGEDKIYIMVACLFQQDACEVCEKGRAESGSAEYDADYASAFLDKPLGNDRCAAGVGAPCQRDPGNEAANKQHGGVGRETVADSAQGAHNCRNVKDFLCAQLFEKRCEQKA